MGFRTCAENVEDSEIKGMLTARARHCAEAASELQNEVRRLGGDPDTHGRVGGDGGLAELVVATQFVDFVVLHAIVVFFWDVGENVC